MCAGNTATILLCLLSITPFATVCLAEDAKQSDKVLRHAVFFKFKDGTSDADVEKVVAAFAALPKKIDSIKEYQRAKNVSPSGFDDGFTDCFLLPLADDAGRQKYLPHPDHKAFGAMLGPHLDKVFVIDYWGKPEKERKERELKHVLFLKYKESATPEQVKEVEEAIAKLPSQCDAVKGF